MNRSRRSFSFSALLVCSLLHFSAGAADGPTFQNLSDEDFKNVVKDLSANFAHTTVSGASTLGDIFGFEIGVVGGQTSTPEVNKLTKEADPSSGGLSKVPHGEIIGMLSIPLALTAEIGLIPKVGSDEFKFSSYHMGLKWTPSELFFELPVALATKLHWSKVDAEFKDQINGIDTTFDFAETMVGLSAIVSKDFAIVEPYFALGYLTADGKMDVNIPNNVFTGNRTSASANPSSATIQIGAELKLLVFKLGVEYMKAFGTDRFTGKLAFYF